MTAAAPRRPESLITDPRAETHVDVLVAWQAGEMGFVMHRPPAPLRPYVAKAYGYTGPPNPTGVHLGLPSRHITLVFDLTHPLVVSLRGTSVRAHGMVGGLHTEPALIDASRPQMGVQYALAPLGVHALLGTSAVALSEQAVDLADVIGAEGGLLLEVLHHAVTWRERFEAVDAVLLRGLRAAEGGPGMVSREVREAWRLVHDVDEHLRVGDVAARVGWSRRHLTERFRLATGQTPIQAIRVARLEATRKLLLDLEWTSLASVASQCGYADQAHMAHEWRSLVGCSMGVWLREELPFLQDSPELTEAELRT